MASAVVGLLLAARGESRLDEGGGGAGGGELREAPVHEDPVVA